MSQRATTPERFWAILPDRLQLLIDSAATIDPKAAISMGNRATQQFQNVGGVAIVEVAGTLTKYGDLWDMLFGTGSAMLDIGAAVREAAGDDSVSSILLRVDSPGGTVAGTADLAAEVAAANLVKPVTAYIEDLGASAAYWISSQAGKVYSNKTAIVGAIGTYATLTDTSELAGKLGVKIHVIKAGDYKGTGVPGSEVTDAQLEDQQRIINSLNSHFVGGVARGRRMSAAAAEKLADGRVHVGSEAESLGLTDGVKSFGDVLAGLQSQAQAQRQRQTPRVPAMESSAAQPQAAGYQPSDDWRKRQEEDRLHNARLSYANQFVAEINDLMAEGKSRQTAERLASISHPEHALVYYEMTGTAGQPAPSARETAQKTNAEVRREVSRLTASGIPKADALRTLRRDNPELWKAYERTLGR
jgi:signal peptide peptidase SppA